MEEELIKELKRIYKGLKFDDGKGRNSIFGILDLYNKQKETIKELETRAKFCKVHDLPKDVVSIVFYKEDFERNFGNDFISKEKIKAKIEELKDSYTDEVGLDIDAMYHNQFVVDCVAILEELMGDDKNDRNI